MCKAKLSFCIECGIKVPYEIRSEKIKMTARGISFDYMELSAFCNRCGNIIYVPEINDRNIDSMEEAFKNKKRRNYL